MRKDHLIEALWSSRKIKKFENLKNYPEGCVLLVLSHINIGKYHFLGDSPIYKYKNQNCSKKGTTTYFFKLSKRHLCALQLLSFTLEVSLFIMELQ